MALEMPSRACTSRNDGGGFSFSIAFRRFLNALLERSANLCRLAISLAHKRGAQIRMVFSLA
jgi:hypothetical protein